MKKIIILAYDYPPYNSMGSQRPYAWFSYFHKLNLYPIIITRHWGETYKDATDYIKPSKDLNINELITNEGTIIRVPYTTNLRDKFILKYGMHKFVLIRKFLSLFYTIFQFISFRFDNKKAIYKTAIKYISNNKVDYIIATGEPFILFKYGYKISKKFSIPWIADYRDCWSLNHVFLTDSITSFELLLYKHYYPIFEKKYVNSASLITTVGDLHQKMLQDFFPNKKVISILNGYFEEKYININSSHKQSETFDIAFGGTIYLFHPLEMFMNAVKTFIIGHNIKDIRIHFYGSKFDSNQMHRIEKNIHGIEPYVNITDRYPRNELFERYAQASCLLIFDNKQMISGKFLEYLPLNRPIIMAGNDNGPMQKIIEHTQSGFVCNTEAEIVTVLETLYKEWKNKGYVVGKTINHESYSRRHQTAILAEAIKKNIG